MAKRKRSATPKTHQQRLKEGRSQGTGSNYKPYLTIRDVASAGLSTRVSGWKSNRVHQFLSLSELHYFFALEWSVWVRDIREQFALDLSETLLIAEELGIKHPQDPVTKVDVPLTVDFLITVVKGIDQVLFARTVKPASELLSRRVIEKFEIEREYFKRRGISWGIVTERDICEALWKNLEWVHPYHTLDQLAPLTQASVRRIESVLLELVSKGDRCLADAAMDCDERLGIDLGSSLQVVRYLIASRKWEVDMHEPIDPKQKLKLIKRK